MRKKGCFVCFVLLITALTITACSTPDEKKARYYNKGLDLVKENKTDEAVIEFKNAVQIDPNFTSAHYQLGLCYLKKRNVKSAFGELYRTAELNPNMIDAQLKLSQIYLLAGKIPEARARVQTVLHKNSHDPEVRYMLSDVLVAENKPAEAIAVLKEIADSDPKQATALVMLGRIFAATGDKMQAEEYFNKGVQAGGNDAGPRLALADFQARNGRLREAESGLKQVISLHSGKSDYYIMLGKLYLGENKVAEAESLFIKATQVEKTIAPHFFLSRYYAGRNKFEPALKELEKAHDIEPKSLGIKNAIAALYYEFGKNSQSEEVVAKILEENKQNMAARLLRGKLRLRNRNYSAALLEFENILKEEPRSSDAKFCIALAHMGKGEMQVAKKTLTELISEIPPQPSIRPRLILAEIYLGEKSFDSAQITLNEVLKLQPGNFTALVLQGDVSLGKRNATESLQFYKQAKNVFPASPVTYYRSGMAYRALGQKKPAIQEFEQALKLNPNFFAALNQIAAIYTQDNNVQQAISRSEQQLRSAANNPYMFNLLGNLYALERKKDLAERALIRAAQLNPNFSEAYLGLGHLYQVNGKIDKAAEQFRLALARNPVSLDAHMQLGIIYEGQGRFDLAQKEYRQVLKISPRFAPAANNLAWNLAEHGGNIDEALSLAQLAKEQSPDDPGISDTLGWVYYRKNVFDGAIREFENAVKRSPNHPTMRYHLGLAYLKKGEKAKASTELTAALNLKKPFPESAQTRQTLASLR